MRNSTKTKLSVFKIILISLLVAILVVGLPYAVILGVAWITDMRHARIAEEIIDVNASEYIEQKYPDNDFDVDKSFHVFKDNCYRVKIRSRSSQDTYFELDYDDQTYALVRDSYESAVLEGRNTYARIVDEYDTLIRDAMDSMPGVSRIWVSFCQYSENTSPGLRFSPDGLDNNTLVPDQVYNVAAMGNEYGYIEAAFLDSEENINIQRALVILTEIDRVLTENGVGYYVMEITIANGAYPDNTSEFVLYGITKEDLSCEDPLARLQEKWDAQEAKRQALKEQWNKADE